MGRRIDRSRQKGRADLLGRQIDLGHVAWCQPVRREEHVQKIMGGRGRRDGDAPSAQVLGRHNVAVTTHDDALIVTRGRNRRQDAKVTATQCLVHHRGNGGSRKCAAAVQHRLKRLKTARVMPQHHPARPTSS
jgi:hypothetical protein